MVAHEAQRLHRAGKLTGAQALYKRVRPPPFVLSGHAASLSQVLQRDPVHFECLANLGKILFASGDFVQAPRPPLSSS